MWCRFAIVRTLDTWTAWLRERQSLLLALLLLLLLLHPVLLLLLLLLHLLLHPVLRRWLLSARGCHTAAAASCEGLSHGCSRTRLG